MISCGKGNYSGGVSTEDLQRLIRAFFRSDIDETWIHADPRISYPVDLWHLHKSTLMYVILKSCRQHFGTRLLQGIGGLHVQGEADELKRAPNHRVPNVVGLGMSRLGRWRTTTYGYPDRAPRRVCARSGHFGSMRNAS